MLHRPPIRIKPLGTFGASIHPLLARAPHLKICQKMLDFYPRDAMLARVIEIATCLSVRPSVRLSVRPSRAGIVSKRRKLAA